MWSPVVGRPTNRDRVPESDTRVYPISAVTDSVTTQHPAPPHRALTQSEIKSFHLASKSRFYSNSTVNLIPICMHMDMGHIPTIVACPQLFLYPNANFQCFIYLCLFIQTSNLILASWSKHTCRILY